MVVPDRGERFERFSFRHGPRGFLDSVEQTSPTRLVLTGWAANPTPGLAGVEVQVFVDGELRARCRPEGRRDDVARHYRDDRYLNAGWSCAVEGRTPIDASRALLFIKAVSANGDSYVLQSSTVADTRRFLELQRKDARRVKLMREQAAIMTSRSGVPRLKAIAAFHYYRAGRRGVIERIPGYLMKKLFRPSGRK